MSNTREAEAFVITEETAVAKGVRRVRGVFLLICSRTLLLSFFVVVLECTGISYVYVFFAFQLPLLGSVATTALRLVGSDRSQYVLPAVSQLQV